MRRSPNTVKAYLREPMRAGTGIDNPGQLRFPEPLPAGMGLPITSVVEFNGTWWSVSGDPPEYSTPIAYCPWCGTELQDQT